MSVDPGVLDTNVLVYATDADAPQYRAARSLLDKARDPVTTLYVTQQVVCEFYSIVTNPRRVKSPCSPSEAQHIISSLIALPGIHVLHSPAGAVRVLLELLQKYPVVMCSICSSSRQCR